MHGFSSATATYDIAQDDDGRSLIILYVGDHDPSGLCMSEVDLPARFDKYGGTHIELRRIALLPEHLTDLPFIPGIRKEKGYPIRVVRPQLRRSVLGTGRARPKRSARDGRGGNTGAHRAGGVEAVQGY